MRFDLSDSVHDDILNLILVGVERQILAIFAQFPSTNLMGLMLDQVAKSV